MDRDLLDRYLKQGLSLPQIGALVNRDPSTVGYWVQKHGLVANGREKYAPRGGLTREELERLIEQGASTHAIARELRVSVSTVRHWLGRYGLRTKPAIRRAHVRAITEAANGAARAILECPRHGAVEFFRRPDHGYRCTECHKEAVVRRRRKVKRILTEEVGGCCAICGYDRYIGALHFHHLDPTKKSFGLSVRGVTRSVEALRGEASKCILLCGNCHAEVEAGFVEVPSR